MDGDLNDKAKGLKQSLKDLENQQEFFIKMSLKYVLII